LLLSTLFGHAIPAAHPVKGTLPTKTNSALHNKLAD
jgi:hypothetical protein